MSLTEEGDLGVIRVADRGIGIREADRARLFELGYRTENAAAVASGLGLGLYIASAIVQLHGGTLDAAARDGGGSVFTIRLPLVRKRHLAVAGLSTAVSHTSPYQFAS